MTMSKLKYVKVIGEKVPQEAYKLTRGEDGIMKDWLNRKRDVMTAYLVYNETTLVGWGAFIINRPKSFFGLFKPIMEISVFVCPGMRGKGIAISLLKRTLSLISRRHPGSIVRYGAPSDHEYFNDVYGKYIPQYSLISDRYFC